MELTPVREMPDPAASITNVLTRPPAAVSQDTAQPVKVPAQAGSRA